MVEQPEKFSYKVKRKMPILLMIWLVFTVLSPHQELYKAFFHLIAVPAGFILIFSGQSGINWKDPFLRVALIFFAYAGITTFFIGLGPVEGQLRAFRWSVEVTFCLLVLFIWMPSVVEKPAWWGRFFLWMALAGALSAIILFAFYYQFKGRLSGLGALHNSIQVASILLVYFSIGYFMLGTSSARSTFRDKLLTAVTFFIVCLAVLLSQSRANIGAMVVYALFLAAVGFLKNPRAAFYFALISMSGIVVLGFLLNHFYGVDGFIDRLLARGMSQRIEIWTGYLQYPPDSWILGFGAGTEAKFHPAAEAYWKPNGTIVSHAHNLILGTLVETGVIGLGFLLTLFILLVKAIIKSQSTTEEKIRLFGILGLIFMITLTGAHTIISSIKAVWLFLWIPVVFMWFWSRKDTNPQPIE